MCMKFFLMKLFDGLYGFIPHLDSIVVIDNEGQFFVLGFIYNLNRSLIIS